MASLFHIFFKHLIEVFKVFLKSAKGFIFIFSVVSELQIGLYNWEVGLDGDFVQKLAHFMKIGRSVFVWFDADNLLLKIIQLIETYGPLEKSFQNI